MKRHTTIIGVRELVDLLAGDEQSVVFDCRFDLGDPARGKQDYEAAHIPGARYLHHDDDLCGPKTGGNGRHPLPAREVFIAVLAGLGINRTNQVVLYDGSDGVYAARAWWMLKWVGHEDAAVLDGGWAAWIAHHGGATADLPARLARGDIALRPSLVPVVDFDAVSRASDDGSRLIVDARAPERYRGDIEPIDPIGGHIPGAANRFFRDNLAPSGAFRTSAELRKDFDGVLAGRAPSEMIAQCGSGVTACHNLLAMAVAGLGGAALYPGSWSEWCARATHDRIAKG